MNKLKNKALTMGLLTTAGVLASGFMNTAQAFTRYNLSSTDTFDNGGGTISGFFIFDVAGINAATRYPLWEITTTATEGGYSGATYTNATSTRTVGTISTFGLSLTSTPGRTISFTFSPSLNGVIPQIVLAGVTEINAGPEGRGISNVQATAVPFESESLPVVGATVLFGLGIWAKNKFKSA